VHIVTTLDPRLVGSWTLEDWRVEYSDGRAASFPYGRDAQGLLMYSPDGWMSGILQHSGRKPLAAESAKFAPDSERLAAFDTYFSYAGPYSVHGNEVHHHVQFALNQNLVGSVQVREMVFEGDTLKLGARDALPGKAHVQRQHSLIWRRTASGDS
jgi:Lipocalin-like domain